MGGTRAGPVGEAVPAEVRQRFRSELPREPADLAEVEGEFMRHVLPYATGNVHPGFMGWVHGGGNPAGVLAEMLAAGLNANPGGRGHAPIGVERQVVAWLRYLFCFPECRNRLFFTGAPLSDLIAGLVAPTGARGTGGL